MSEMDQKKYDEAREAGASKGQAKEAATGEPAIPTEEVDPRTLDEYAAQPDNPMTAPAEPSEPAPKPKKKKAAAKKK
jgi:hypothetical protein